MSEEVVFETEVSHFKLSDLVTRQRFREKLRLECLLDDKKFKSEKQPLGGSDLVWNLEWRGTYTTFTHRALEDKFFEVRVLTSSKQVFGRVRVDLYTCATGPADHNLPLMNGSETVGRLAFTLNFNQVTNVAVVFKELKFRNLRSPEPGVGPNPYAKYAYRGQWKLVQDGKMKACYSDVQPGNPHPIWHDLPPMRFKASMKELLHEAIVLHVTHAGKVKNTTLGRANLLFRTLVDDGRTFKDEDLISFAGPLKKDGAEIEGLLQFQFLPKFAQMKAANALRRPVHTENGILDGVPLLPNMPRPKNVLVRMTSAEFAAGPKPEASGPAPLRHRSNSISTPGYNAGISPARALSFEEDETADDDDDQHPRSLSPSGSSATAAPILGSALERKRSVSYHPAQPGDPPSTRDFVVAPELAAAASAASAEAQPRSRSPPRALKKTASVPPPVMYSSPLRHSKSGSDLISFDSPGPRRRASVSGPPATPTFDPFNPSSGPVFGSDLQSQPLPEQPLFPPFMQPNVSNIVMHPSNPFAQPAPSNPFAAPYGSVPQQPGANPFAPSNPFVTQPVAASTYKPFAAPPVAAGNPFSQ
eukprot:TRINITY_DN547_c0_g2_i2.p1 TRINITY_DN547_c0_g2~~TRINITY_DN547_c0_g2_i2.p1  ORF type:complete len:587 (+),score=127.72 TRINITY_DN547_c0_g2_i2:94-1854(+)